MRKLFYLVVAIQILFLLVEVAYTEIQMRTGRVIVLRVAPIDPRSLLMGNYIDLSYDISTIGRSSTRFEQPIPHLEPGDTVYAILRPAKPYAEIVGLTAERPSQTTDDLVYLKGRVVPSWDGGRLMVEYGIERYYIPEARERDVSRMAVSRRRTIGVEAVVTGDGRGIIRRVLVNGKPIGF